MNRKIMIIFFIGISILNEGFAEIIAKPNVEYTADGLRDPFEGYLSEQEEASQVPPPPEEQEVPALPPLTIQGIIWGGRFPLGIINNKVVKIGDTIEGAQIIDISKDGVIVSFADRQYNLSSPAAVNLENLDKKLQGGKDEGN